MCFGTSGKDKDKIWACLSGYFAQLKQQCFCRALNMQTCRLHLGREHYRRQMQAFNSKDLYLCTCGLKRNCTSKIIKDKQAILRN